MQRFDNRGLKFVVQDQRRIMDELVHMPGTRITYKKWSRMQPVRWRVMLLFGALCMPLLAMIVVSYVVNVKDGWSFAITMIVVVPSVVMARRLANREETDSTIRYLVAIGRCGACGYDLNQLPVESDGCTVCPECGAAWRASADSKSKSSP